MPHYETDFGNITLHPATAHELQHMEVGWPDKLLELKIAIDGSGGKIDGAIPARAVAIRAKCQNGAWMFGGFLARKIHSDRDIKDFIGLTQLDSCGAELNGAVSAMMVALQYPGTPVEIAYDATYAAQSVEAITNPKCNIEAVTVATGLNRLLCNVSVV